MALTIERTIDLTDYPGNPDPRVVEQLSIIHESADGELVQYYIKPGNQTQGDKNTYAIGVFDEDSRTYSYHDYPDLEWNRAGQRICGNRIERLGVKAFPGVGAIAFYKLTHRKISRIIAPVNNRNKRLGPPSLAARVNSNGTITFTITPPEEPEYSCYRIIMQKEDYMEEHITYDLKVTVEAPRISGEYSCFAVGYGKEGQLYSKDSNVVNLSLTGQAETFQRPYYMKSEIASRRIIRSLEERIEALEERLEGGDDEDG